ncbi:hypothetical protein G9A89_006257 [Geosiphon pyriformis]|nr:hypothetical protein G9A89_006257 [Geosiphon pyriformis]
MTFYPPSKGICVGARHSLSFVRSPFFDKYLKIFTAFTTLAGELRYIHMKRQYEEASIKERKAKKRKKPLKSIRETSYTETIMDGPLLHKCFQTFAPIISVAAEGLYLHVNQGSCEDCTKYFSGTPIHLRQINSDFFRGHYFICSHHRPAHLGNNFPFLNQIDLKRIGQREISNVTFVGSSGALHYSGKKKAKLDPFAQDKRGYGEKVLNRLKYEKYIEPDHDSQVQLGLRGEAPIQKQDILIGRDATSQSDISLQSRTIMKTEKRRGEDPLSKTKVRVYKNSSHKALSKKSTPGRYSIHKSEIFRCDRPVFAIRIEKFDLQTRFLNLGSKRKCIDLLMASLQLKNRPRAAWNIIQSILRMNLLKYMKFWQVHLLSRILWENSTHWNVEWLVQFFKDLKNSKHATLISKLYHALLKKHANEGKTDAIVNLIKKMDGAGIKVDKKRVPELMLIYGNSYDLESGQKVFDAILDTNTSINSEGFGTLADLYRKNNNYAGAYRTLNNFYLSGGVPSGKLYAIVIDAAVRHRKWRKGFALLKEGKRNWAIPNINSFASLINGYCQEPKLSVAILLYHKMCKQGITPSKYIFTTLIISHLLNRDVTGASNFYKMMIEKNKVHDRYLLSIILTMKASEYIDMGKALEVYEEMKAENFVPENLTFREIMLFNNKRPGDLTSRPQQVLCEAVKELSKEMIQPNKYRYNILVNAYSDRWSFPLAMAVLQLMDLKSGTIEPQFMEPLLGQLVFSTKSPLAWISYDRLVAKGKINNLEIFERMFSFATSISEYQVSYRAFKTILGTNQTVPIQYFEKLITGLCRHLQIDQAIDILNEMLEQDILPTLVIFTDLMRGVAIKRRFKQGMEIYRLMECLKVSPDSKIFDHLDKLHLRTGHLAELVKFHKTVIKGKSNIEPLRFRIRQWGELSLRHHRIQKLLG